MKKYVLKAEDASELGKFMWLWNMTGPSKCTSVGINVLNKEGGFFLIHIILNEKEDLLTDVMEELFAEDGFLGSHGWEPEKVVEI